MIVSMPMVGYSETTMKSITTTTARIIATTALRHSWSVLNVATRLQSRGERLEAWAHRVAVRWGCFDDVIDTVVSEARCSR